MMKIYSEDQLIAGIRNHDSGILEYVYKTYFPVIENYVVHNQGSREQAKDVFQEAMIIIYNRIKERELELRCRFGTYLYAVCKHTWVQEKKKYKLRAEKLKNHPLKVQEPALDEDPLMEEQLTAIFETHFNALSTDCQKILLMWFNDRTVEEIRTSMNYKDVHHAADRKYRCKKSLIKRIVNDPLFKRLKNEIR